MSNPFFYGNPVSPDQFIDRWREVRRITGRIVNQGQSTAVIGEPRSGKTSLLEYLAAPQRQAVLYGSDGERLLFSFIDNEILGGQFTQAQFWQLALRPLYERVIVPSPNSLLAQGYQVCQENAFGAFVLERLLAQMRTANWRLVLLLDEFDALLYHPILNSAEFFGSLRGSASRSGGALALVIASRQSLTSLNEATQQFSRSSSPYFNFLSEISLGSWPIHAVAELLERAVDRFEPDDRVFITGAAGAHPYLLQIAAYEMWAAHDEEESDPVQRRQQVGQRLFDEAMPTLSDIWRLWSPVMRMAFTAIALPQLTLTKRQFQEERLLSDIRDFGSELQILKKRGFITEDATTLSGWRVRPQVFLWWLTGEVVRTVRDESTFEGWLREQEWEGMMTRGGKEQLGKALRALTGILKDGATTLIEAAAKGVGEALAK